MKTLKRFGSMIVFMIFLSGSTISAQQVFFGNLHSHTSYSDGAGTPEQAYLHARDAAGLDFLAITEHNHSEAGRIQNDTLLYNGEVSTSLIAMADRFSVHNQFVAIYGQEFSSISSGNHANILEIGSVISTNEVPNGRWDNLLNDWLPRHKDSQGQDAIILLNHPSIGSSPNDREYGIDDFTDFNIWRSTLDRHAQLINIINGPSHDQDNPGSPSESELLRYLNMGLHIAPTADQDNHRTNWGSAADTRTAVITSSLSKENVLQALRERHVYASEDKNLEIVATVNGQLMGTIFDASDTPATNSELNFQVSINDPDEAFSEYVIEVFFDNVVGGSVADVINRFNSVGNGIVNLTGIRYTGGDQYFFLKVTQTDIDGEIIDHAWTAPVWFEPSREPGGTDDNLPNTVAMTLKVDELAEEAVITNLGSASINLRDWVLVSLRGDQRFTFTRNTNLGPQGSITVVSGSNASRRTNAVVWTTNNIWNNSGDPGQLFDQNGILRAEDAEE